VNAKIEIDGIWSPKPRRQHDRVIMDEILKHDLSKQEIRIFNNWRVFFQVLTISDLTNQQGTHIRQRFLNKNSSVARLGRQDIKWPNQERPNNKYFYIWTKGLKLITGMGEDRSLKNKLGNWIIGTNETTSSPSLLHKNNQLLAVQDETTNMWCLHNLEYTAHAKMFFNRTNSLETPEIELSEYIPIDITTKGQYHIVNPRTRRSDKKQNYTQKRNNKNNILQQMEKINDWSRNITDNIIIYNEEIIQEENDSTMIITSDAGVRNGLGGFGVVISVGEEIILECKNRVPITFNELHSYRAEGIGILCGLTIYKQMKKTLETNGKKIVKKLKIHCDNEAMIKSIRRIKRKIITPKMIYISDIDVIREIIDTILYLENENVEIEIKHVKGHQDRTNKQLTTEALLNIRADELATESIQMKSIPSIQLPNTRAKLCSNELEVTANQSYHLKTTFHSIQMREYLESSNNWKGKTIDNVWWKIHGSSIESIKKGKTTIHKFIHGRLPCNQRNHRYYPYKPKCCKLCGDNQTEDQMHFLQCKSCPERGKRRIEFFRELQNNMISTGTHETTTRTLLSHITSFLQQEDYKNINDIAPDASPHFKQTILDQEQIGWDQLLKGRISIKWGELYNHDIETDKLKLTMKDAECWGKRILAIIWKFIIDMWKIRNDKEHNLDGQSSEIKKTKEIEQIMWLIRNIKEYDVNHPYRDATEVTLTKYPLNNLKIMNTQLQTLYESEKIKHTSRTGKNKLNQKSMNNKGNKSKKTYKKIKVEKLSQTAQVISHISTHVGGPHSGVD
jgi:hypothetical protein